MPVCVPVNTTKSWNMPTDTNIPPKIAHNLTTKRINELCFSSVTLTPIGSISYLLKLAQQRSHAQKDPGRVALILRVDLCAILGDGVLVRLQRERTNQGRERVPVIQILGIKGRGYINEVGRRDNVDCVFEGGEGLVCEFVGFVEGVDHARVAFACV
jgi:hypothetical protein